jgi:hypothetical protein
MDKNELALIDKKERLHLPPSAPAHLVAEVEAEMAKVGDSYHLALAEREQAEGAKQHTTDRLKIADNKPVNEIIKGKEDKTGMTTQANYPYLMGEDVNFARAFRLSEDDFLGFFGGLRGYTAFRLDRDRARSEGFDVPRLPSRLEDVIASMNVAKVSEKDYATFLAKDMAAKVADINKTRKMNTFFKERMGIDTTKPIKPLHLAEDPKADDERLLKEFRNEASRKLGVSEDSQTAQDYAAQELVLYKRRRIGK